MEPARDDDEVYEIDLCFELEPASVQSSRRKKDKFAAVVREAASKYPFLIVDDVRLTIEWVMNEQSRYESDRKADIDNIIKPLFDSLCGPDGLLVDDTLIQSYYCGWLDHTLDNDVLHVRIASVTSESISEVSMDRDSLIFVEVNENLFFPLDDSLSGEIRRVMLEAIVARFPMRDRIHELTGSYDIAKRIMPVQRIFHKSRVVRFPHFGLAEYLGRLPPAPVIPL